MWLNRHEIGVSCVGVIDGKDFCVVSQYSAYYSRTVTFPYRVITPTSNTHTLYSNLQITA